jgi:hypothetical protein
MGLVFAAAYSDSYLSVTVVAEEFVGTRWFKRGLELLGASADQVLRGRRLVLESGMPLSPAAGMWRSGGSLLLALLPLVRLGGKVEAIVDADEAAMLADAAEPLGLHVSTKCGEESCMAILESSSSSRIPSHNLVSIDPDYLYPFTASLAAGGSIKAPYYYAEDPLLASSTGVLKVEDEALLASSPESLQHLPRSCSGLGPVQCAYLYGLHAYGYNTRPQGLELLDDRLPGFLAVAEEAGCLE